MHLALLLRKAKIIWLSFFYIPKRGVPGAEKRLGFFCPAPPLISLHPGGMLAFSRWLSAAIPPVTKSKTSRTLNGCQTKKKPSPFNSKAESRHLNAKQQFRYLSLHQWQMKIDCIPNDFGVNQIVPMWQNISKIDNSTVVINFISQMRGGLYQPPESFTKHLK